MSEKPKPQEVVKREVISTACLEELLTIFRLTIKPEEIICIHPDVTDSEFREVMAKRDMVNSFNDRRFDETGNVIGDSHIFFHNTKGFGHRFMKKSFDIRCYYHPVDQNPDGKITGDYDENDDFVKVDTTNYYTNITPQKQWTIFHLDTWAQSELFEYITLRRRYAHEPVLYGRHMIDEGTGIKLIEVTTALAINPYSTRQESPYMRLGLIFDPITKDTQLIGFKYDGERIQICQFFEGKVDLYRIIQ
jgi:hypothetical protein